MASDPQLPYNRVWGGAPVPGHNHVTVAFIKQRTSIRVIDHTHDEQGTIKQTAFWRALEQGGWDIALSEHPCVMKPLKHKKTQDAFRPEIERKGFFHEELLGQGHRRSHRPCHRNFTRPSVARDGSRVR